MASCLLTETLRPLSGRSTYSPLPPIASKDTCESDDADEAEKKEDKVEVSQEEMIQSLLAGRLDHQYPLTQKIVRIFTSSTFTGEIFSSIDL